MKILRHCDITGFNLTPLPIDEKSKQHVVVTVLCMQLQITDVDNSVKAAPC